MPTSQRQALASQSQTRAVNETIQAVLDWIDRELGEAFEREAGRGGNTLLELRKVFQSGNLNQAVSQFFRQLSRLERHHYLLGFRIRTLLSSQIRLRVSDPLERTPGKLLPLPSAQNFSTAEIRRNFFEHAVTDIPLGDIRIAFVNKNDPAQARLD